MAEVKKCPFCGKLPKDYTQSFICETDGCPASTISVDKTKWNTRPIEDALSAKLSEANAEIERLKKIIDKILPKHRHDHSYYHDNCGLCQMEKEEYENITKRAN
jgi:hypothetical protein